MTRAQLQARRTRIQALLSRFALFRAKGITSLNLMATRGELERELEEVNRNLKLKESKYGVLDLRTHS